VRWKGRGESVGIRRVIGKVRERGVVNRDFNHSLIGEVFARESLVHANDQREAEGSGGREGEAGIKRFFVQLQNQTLGCSVRH